MSFHLTDTGVTKCLSLELTGIVYYSYLMQRKFIRGPSSLIVFRQDPHLLSYVGVTAIPCDIYVL